MLQTASGWDSWIEDVPQRYSTTWETGWPWGFAIGFAVLCIAAVVVLIRNGDELLMRIAVVPAAVYVILLQLIARHTPSDAGTFWLYFGSLLVGGTLLLFGKTWPGWVLVGGSVIYGIYELITRFAAGIPAPVPFVIFIIVVIVIGLRRR